MSRLTAEQRRHVRVDSVDSYGVCVRGPLVPSGRAHVSWDDLRAAAYQDDPSLSAVYSSILDTAVAIAMVRSPLRVCYGQDSTGVWWTTWVETEWGGLRIGSRWHTMTIMSADEGGTLPRAWMAEREARDIVARIATIAPGRSVSMVQR